MRTLLGSLSLGLAGAAAFLSATASEAAMPVTPLTNGAAGIEHAYYYRYGYRRYGYGYGYRPYYHYGYGYRPYYHYGYGYHPYYHYGYHPYYHYYNSGGNSHGANFPQ